MAAKNGLIVFLNIIPHLSKKIQFIRFSVEFLLTVTWLIKARNSSHKTIRIIGIGIHTCGLYFVQLYQDNLQMNLA